MLKRLISIAAAFIILFTLTGCTLTERDLIDKSYELNSPPRLMFLGDSIAACYGLNGYTLQDNYSCPDSYANILNEKYTSDLRQICPHEMQNFAVSGATSADLMELLNSGKLDSALAETDAVVVSIGGNDLLENIYPIISSLGITVENKEIDLSNIDVFSLIGQITTLEEDVSNSLAEFEVNLKEITSVLDIKTECDVYIQTLYNPFENFTDISMVKEFTQTTIVQFNDIIKNNTADKYKIIDIAADFEGKCNDLTRIGEIDIHPNEAGHKVIAEAVDEALTAETYIYTTQIYGEPHLTLMAIILIAGGILAMLIVVVVLIPKMFRKYE
ncbi:MAG: SGNH/GDSL hydrolase family protein [Ruminococcus sp.]|nr:SGNH/GDSL hydrolase family protein [Ruminococcus sp.]